MSNEEECYTSPFEFAIHREIEEQYKADEGYV